MLNGLLLINLGTPDNPSTSAVRRYLRLFLTDKRVVDLPFPLRSLLVYLCILPFRPRQTAKNYQAIWTKEGSPLLYHSQQLADHLQHRLGKKYKVALGMRYGTPSLQHALQALSQCQHLTILPLYPHYSSAATGSSIEKILQLIARQQTHPTINLIRDFYSHPSFINAQACLIKPYLHDHEYLLFSYHGIPERQILRSGCKQVCKTSCPSTLNNPVCYRAQCHHTTQKLSQTLELSENQYGMSFQSRLGKTPWIQPYTDTRLKQLRQQGIKRLAIACPSFVADCLETLEEIGLRAREEWHQMGGETLTLIPSLNADDLLVEAIVDICGLNRLNNQ